VNGNAGGRTKMTVAERISLCRFLEKIEEQETYCAAIGVRDVSKIRGREMTQGTRNAEDDRKRV